MALDSEIEKNGQDLLEKFWSETVPMGFLFGMGMDQSEQVEAPKGLFRKERILVVPITHLMGILSGRAKIWFPDEIPSDCFPLRTFQDESSHSICIVVGHPSFKPVKEGFVIPRFTVTVSYPEVAPATRPVEAVAPEEDDKEREI